MVRLAPAALVLLLFGLAGCGGDEPPTVTPTPTPTAAPPTLKLDFDEGLTAGAPVTSVQNTGTGQTDVDVRATGGAKIQVVKGREGGNAIRFPAYTGAAKAPAAVLVAEDMLDGTLDPASGDFSFGATFQLDEKSAGSEADNGNNLIQRGNFDSLGQYKLQVDKDVPSCRVLGDDGEVFVKSDTPIDPGHWYTVTCTRTESEVTLTVEAYDGAPGAGTWKTKGPTGTISLKALPLTVGGKTTPNGTPVGSPDQFNGVVDDVFLSLG